MKRKLLGYFAVMVMLSACTSLYKGVITVTQIRDSAMKELAQLYKKGLISPEMDKKIYEADVNYRAAALLTEQTLTAYKSGSGSQEDYLTALNTTKLAISGILDILRPLVISDNVRKLDNDLKLAGKL